MALAYAKIVYEHREVVLSDKPQALLDVSPQATVPVMVLTNQQVLTESLDIMHWAIMQSDQDAWYDSKRRTTIDVLIHANDTVFKPMLDRYKYPEKSPEQSQADHRAQACRQLMQLEMLLTSQAYLGGERMSLADVAIFPFVRQFAHVDFTWFCSCELSKLVAWEQAIENSDLFQNIMQKFTPWQPGDPAILR